MPVSAPPAPSRSEATELAARVMVGTAWVAVALLVGSALLNEVFGEVTRFSRLRGLFGLVLLAAAAFGQWQVKKRPRLASAVVLAGGMAAAWVHVFLTGIGLHALVLTASLFAIALSGVLISMGTASLFAGINALMLLVAYAAERDGRIGGLGAAIDLGAGERLLGQLLFTVLALMAALILTRVLSSSLGRALDKEQRLDELLLIGSDWTWELDEHGFTTALSPTFTAHTGRTVEEFLQAGRPGGPQPVDDADWRSLRQELQARRPFRDRLSLYRCADGTELAVVASGNPRHDAQGRFIGWRGVSRDVTALHLQQKAQARNQLLLDRLVQMSPDAICVARLQDGSILLANPRFLQLAGLAEDQVIGRSALQLGLWRDPSVPKQLRDALARDGQVRDLRTVVHVAEGEPRPMQLTAATFEWDREPVVVITTRDVADIERARAEAESANQAKSAFLATMSHEIRTPLNGVLGLARLMQDPSLDAARRDEFLGHLVAAAEQLGGLVSDVLDLSKIEAGHLQVESIGFDLPALVHRTFSGFAPLGRERGLVMHCTVHERVPTRVQGDPVRVRQILANYLGNALKFTQQGSIALRVTVGEADRVRIEVADTGPGVEPATSAMLFRPFAQADSSTTRRYGGTGLGLSICRELAERMGGAVGVDSDGRSGSRFWAELVLPAEAGQPVTPTGAAAHPLNGLQVLVAEDNTVNRLIVGAMLRRMGAQVQDAENGEQAVQLATSGQPPPHVVLMDLHMPEVDGLEATRRLRAQRQTADLPIYALSAAVLEQERQAASDAGMNGFVAKPVIESELLQALRPWVPVSA
jgi:PAS domain S-box-containing protein